MNHGLALRAARVNKGISVAEMADKLGIEKADLCRIEHSAKVNRLYPVVRLFADILEVKLTPSEADGCDGAFDEAINEKYKPVVFYRTMHRRW